MRFEDLTVKQIHRAIDVYLQQAWGDEVPPAIRKLVVDIDLCCELDIALELFEAESSETYADGSGQGGFRRYALRLGNRSYPFMKLVIQEHLLNGEFFFSVDTHDNLGVDASNPDYEAWCELKRRNQALKIAIESAWECAGIPTQASLRVLMESLASEVVPMANQARILIVDDEADVAVGLKALLTARGFIVELAHDGVAALKRLSEGPRPDLLMLDNDMPELDGKCVVTEVRARPMLKGLPVLMTTAGRLTLKEVGDVNAFLRKPYPRQDLFKMFHQLLAAR